MSETNSNYAKIPVYRESKKTACDTGSLELYHASMAANMACRDAIEAAIAKSYSNDRLNTDCVKAVLEQFGAERVKYVLASTVRYNEHDTRYSADNRAWAKTVEVCSEDSHWIVVGRTHPGLVDLFLSRVRRDAADNSES